MYESMKGVKVAADQIVDLRSDTLTHPTDAMRQAMATAVVGDDQYGEDPTVNRLEALSAEMLGKEAAVFVTSGTQGNLSAILAHCARGDEIVLGDEAHILHYESAAPAALGGISPRTIHNAPDGTFDLDELRSVIRQPGQGLPPTTLICVENTLNRCSGAVLPIEHLQQIHAIAKEHDLPLHMDGARIFNAAIALGVPPKEIAATVDTVQFCLSKGLAAPVGSLVVGSAEFITHVRRYRKMLGGALRQSGVIAAAGIVALETMVDRLKDDHDRARQLAVGIAEIDGLTINLELVHSNIVVAQPDRIDKAQLIRRLLEHGILVSDFGTKGIRFVTHYEISTANIDHALDVLREQVAELRTTTHA